MSAVKKILNTVFDGGCLDSREAEEAMKLIIVGQLSNEQVAAFLGAVHPKRVTIDEIVAFARVLRDHAIPVPIQRKDLIDTAGTGGDGAETFNISTATAFVLAGAGLGVAKHGNRSVSSKCGSADVIEALGIPIDLKPEQAARAVDQNGFGFLFAPHYHPALKTVAPVRKALGVRTVFNLLGPLVNPARVKRQVMGVYDSSFLEVLAACLRELGSEEAMVISAEDGLDEFSLCAKTRVAHLKDGEIKTYQVSPEDVGIKRCRPEDLKGGDAQVNADILKKIFEGEKGPKRDAVVLNSAAALVVSGIAKDFKEGVRLAEESIDQGRAGNVIRQARESK